VPLFDFGLRYTTFPMKITRRILALSLLFVPLVFSFAGGSADKPAANNRYLIFVGTYTTKTNSKGIYSLQFDTTTGKLSELGVAAETPDPSWVVVHPSGKFLYAVNEAGKASTVSAFAIDAKSGKLTLLNQVPSLGEDPCYLSFDKTGKYVFVANYTSGNVVVFPIGADGKLNAATANVRDEGKPGPIKERQDAPHAHWVEPSEHNHFVYVADLGLDHALAYAFDASTGTLTANRKFSANKTRAVALLPGTGPRHITFSENFEFMYVLGELSSKVTVLATHNRKPYQQIQVISALPTAFSGRNDAAEIAIYPNGKFLYASNRGRDSIALFNIDAATGKLTAAGDFSVQGKEPRHFAIDPNGKYLLAENQLSNNIVVFKIDSATGGLTPTGQVLEVPSPVDIAFLRED
jgi:6-phosphogluconolactonase